jgi:hypothetical protein
MEQQNSKMSNQAMITEQQNSCISNQTILLMLFGVLFIIIFICYIHKKNVKRCKKECKCRRRHGYTKESYRSLSPTVVLQTTTTGDLSTVDINPIIKNFIDDKSSDTSASFNIKELTTVGNVKGSKLCIGATCLSEDDLKNLIMITTSKLNTDDIKLLKALGTGAYMEMNGNKLGSMTTANGDYYAFPSYDTGSGYTYKSGISTFKFSL